MIAVALSVLIAWPGSSMASYQPSREAGVAQCLDWIGSRPQRPERNTAATEIVAPGVACFDGDLLNQTIAPATRWLDERRKNGGGASYLVVRSTGGDAGAGIALAEKLRRNDVTVVIVDYCMSSCANYLFAAAPRRRLVDRPLVLFHGGFSDAGRIRYAASLVRDLANPEIAKLIKDQESWRAKQLAYYDGGLHKQRALYAEAGVDIGLVDAFETFDLSAIPDERCGALPGGRRDMLFFDTRQLRRMGIRIDAGSPATDAKAVNGRLRSLGISTVACAAPDRFGVGAAQKARLP